MNGQHSELEWSQQTANGGDTAGLAANAAGVFRPVWIDRTTGIQQVWTSRISVAAQGRVDRKRSSGWPTSRSRSRCCSRTAGSTSTLTVDAALANASKAPISGPFKVRVTSLTSPYGLPEVANGDNGVTRSGAVWDFAPSAGGELRPGALTATRATDLSAFRTCGSCHRASATISGKASSR